MTPDQLELLADIQRLTIAGYRQTGIPLAHSVTARASVDGMAIDSSVTVMPTPDQPWSFRATTGPYHSPGETTLAQQRDALARWIAAHRKEDAA